MSTLNCNVTPGKVFTPDCDDKYAITPDGLNSLGNPVVTVELDAEIAPEDLDADLHPLGYPAEDGLTCLRMARATYDFAEHGGAIGDIGLDVSLPDKAVIVGGMVDVITTLASATDAATVAIKTEAANDIVSAIAISDGTNPWDSGRHAVVPLMTAATSKKMSAEKEIIVTVAVEVVTAGKFVVVLYYFISA